MGNPIRVLIVDDSALVRQILTKGLSADPDIEVVGEAGDGSEAIQRVKELRPDIVLMDISMPGMNGLTATRYILEAHPDVRIIILTQYDSKEYILPLLQVGASGYVLKQCADTDLVKAIRSVYAGDSFLYPSVARTLLESYLGKEENATHEELTPREREILVLIAQGYTNRQIAEILHISPKTVDVHRSRLMKKLDLHNVADLTRYAIRHGLVDLT